jgi:hypothetical protein
VTLAKLWKFAIIIPPMRMFRSIRAFMLSLSKHIDLMPFDKLRANGYTSKKGWDMSSDYEVIKEIGKQAGIKHSYVIMPIKRRKNANSFLC